MYFDKKILQGFASQNYKELRVPPVKCMYKHFSILFLSSQIIYECKNKRDIRAFDISVCYTKKEYGKLLVDYLDPTCFNSLSFNIKNVFLEIILKIEHIVRYI